MGDNSNNINIDDPDFTLEILIPDIEGWALVKTIDNYNEILSAEHVKGCSREWDPDNPGWGWEYFDVDSSEDHDKCWQCGKVVPKEIVGLVAMLNWEAVASLDKRDWT
jgi:hypothetical protein